MKRMLLALCVTVLLAGVAAAQNFIPKTGGVTNKTVSVTASNAAVQACAAVVDGCTIQVPADAVVPIRMVLVNAGTLCSAITVKRGILIAPGSGFVCSPYEPGGYCYNWTGQVCLLLEAGSTAVSTEVVER